MIVCSMYVDTANVMNSTDHAQKDGADVMNATDAMSDTDQNTCLVQKYNNTILTAAVLKFLFSFIVMIIYLLVQFIAGETNTIKKMNEPEFHYVFFSWAVGEHSPTRYGPTLLVASGCVSLCSFA